MDADDKLVGLVPEIVGAEPDDFDMPPDAAAAFEVYRTTGNRSIRRVARLLSRPDGTVLSWSHRYRWTALLGREDVEVGQGSFQRAMGVAAELRMQAFLVLAEGMQATRRTYDAAGVLIAEDPDWKVRTDAAKALLDRAGMRPYASGQLVSAATVQEEWDGDAGVDRALSPEDRIVQLRKQRRS